MNHHARHAATILRVYLARGEQALGELIEGEIDAAEKTLKLRRSAFLNFRVVNALAEELGYSEEQMRALKETWIELQRVDAALAAMLATLTEKESVNMKRIVSARAKLGRYRSGETEAPNFERSV